MSARPHALVIGGSVGGLFAAGLLRGIGWNVTVFERSTGDLAGRGAGIGISRELLEVMQRIGARFDASIGVAIRSYLWLDASGGIVHEHPRPMASSTWARVYRRLRHLLPEACYRPGMTLARIEPAADHVTAIFSDGARVAGDLLIAADGNQSTVRQQFLSEVEPRYAGYVAWRGILAEDELSPATRALVDEHIVFSFPEGEMMLAMPVPGDGEHARASGGRYYFIWYRPADLETTVPALFTDAAGRCHGIAIPPPLIRRELLQEVKAAAEEIFAPEAAAMVVRARQPLLQAIFDLESPRLTFGRVALLGDAAFIARPHVAAGITKAALDAQSLADALVASKGDIAAALAHYDRTQQRFGSRIVAHARYLGAYLEGAARHRDPAQIMRDYGAPHLLHDADVAGFGGAAT